MRIARRSAWGDPRGRELRRFAVGALLALGCHRRSITDVAPDTPVTVRVVNDAFPDYNVYALHSGQRIRLGIVTGHTSIVLRVPPGVVFGATPLAFLADPIGGGRRRVSEPEVVFPGDEVTFQIPP